ncbi:hypothetical protein HY218_00235 [Candidatus Saccharibacteria bacterium]|nr:hypothetical protein [Candidatus Saccharibacteria bacterium]
MNEVAVPNPDFEAQKTDYFVQLGVHVQDALKLHKARGLWERDAEGKRDWGNVSEHCLVEAARAREFGQLLGFEEGLIEDLITAAALHDFYKKDEKAIVTKQGLSWEAFEEASHESSEAIREAGFSDRIAWLVGAVGHGSLLDTKEILEETEPTPDQEAFLVMHYIDDYTVGSDWAEPASGVSNFDIRMDKNEANERYRLLNEEGRPFFNGRTTFEIQRQLGHEIEARLVDMINVRSGQHVSPADLPVFIDDQIRTRIASPTQQAA